MLLASRGAVARNAAQPPKMHSKEVSCPSVTSAGVESPALRDRPLFISSIEDVKAAGKTATRGQPTDSQGHVCEHAAHCQQLTRRGRGSEGRSHEPPHEWDLRFHYLGCNLEMLRGS